MVAPRGEQELKNVRKPHSADTVGPPFGSPFSRFFSIFPCFCGPLFLRVVFGRFLGSILSGFWEDFGRIYCGFRSPCAASPTRLVSQ